MPGFDGQSYQTLGLVGAGSKASDSDFGEWVHQNAEMGVEGNMMESAAVLRKMDLETTDWEQVPVAAAGKNLQCKYNGLMLGWDCD